MRGLLLPILFWQCNQLGTMFRIGRDGHSAVHTAVVRVLVLLLPTLSLGYALFKMADFDMAHRLGHRVPVVTSMVGTVVCTLGEIMFSYLAFVRIVSEGPDYGYLVSVEEVCSRIGEGGTGCRSGCRNIRTSCLTPNHNPLSPPPLHIPSHPKSILPGDVGGGGGAV